MLAKVLWRCVVAGIFMVFAFCISGVAMAKMVRVDIDPAYPSWGSRAPMVFSGQGFATVNLLTTDPGMAPQTRSTPGGPRTPGASLTFTGMTQTPSLDGGYIYKPPDTHFAVGTGAGAAGRIVHVTNRGIQIFDKTGATVVAALDLDAFLTGLGASGLTGSGTSNLSFDPKVIFDQHSGRFFVAILDGRTAGSRSNLHICTSTSATPGNLTSNWTLETGAALTTIDSTATWMDYPCIGADSTRLVVTGNLFDASSNFMGAKVRVFLKSSLTDNGSPSGATYNDIDIADSATSGVFTVQPAHVFGSTLNGDFYLIDRVGSTSYRLWQITGAGGAASLVTGSPSAHAWTAGAYLSAGAPQISGAGAHPTISTLSARIQNAVYRDDSIWLALTSDSDSDSRTEVVWFEIDPNNTNSATAGTPTTPTTVQSGAIDGSGASDWTFMPSIMVNAAGHALINYSESGSAKAVDMRVVAREATDTAGTFQAPVVIDTGAGEYDDFNSDDPERWGDYSGNAVDPDDDQTFWVANELCSTAVTAGGDDAVWKTTIAKMGSVPVELMSFTIE